MTMRYLQEGLGKSERALHAEASGLLTIGRFARSVGLSASQIVDLADEWHHTGKYGRRTYYIDPMRLADEDDPLAEDLAARGASPARLAREIARARRRDACMRMREDFRRINWAIKDARAHTFPRVKEPRLPAMSVPRPSGARADRLRRIADRARRRVERLAARFPRRDPRRHRVDVASRRFQRLRDAYKAEAGRQMARIMSWERTRAYFRQAGWGRTTRLALPAPEGR